jgi:hypothetical protein
MFNGFLDAKARKAHQMLDNVLADADQEKGGKKKSR